MKAIRWLLYFLLLISLLLLIRPDDAITLSFVQRAAAYRSSIDYQLSADHLRVAVVRQPWNASLRVQLAEVLLLQSRTAEALSVIDEAAQLGADSAAVARLQALLAEKDRRWAAAAQHWQNVSTLRPLDETAYQGAVAAALQTEQWSVARDTAERWVATVGSSEAHLMLGKLLAFDDPAAAKIQWQLSHSDQAQPFLPPMQQTDRALQAMFWGRAYLAQNDLVLAQRAFDNAVMVNLGYAEAHAFAGFVADQRGADGSASLDRAVDLDPNLIVARYFRARHRWTHGDLDGALADLQYAINRDPSNALIVAEIGRVYTQRSDFATAEQWLTQARDLRPQDVTIWKALAELYVGRAYGTPDQAVTTARQIVTLAPEEAEAHVWLGRAYLRSGDRNGAESELLAAVRLAPQSALAHFYVGRLYGQHTDAGRMEYERALALDPEGAIGLAARRVIELP